MDITCKSSLVLLSKHGESDGKIKREREKE